jgi:hypothetical protein
VKVVVSKRMSYLGVMKRGEIWFMANTLDSILSPDGLTMASDQA